MSNRYVKDLRPLLLMSNDCYCGRLGVGVDGWMEELPGPELNQLSAAGRQLGRNNATGLARFIAPPPLYEVSVAPLAAVQLVERKSNQSHKIL